MELRQLEYFLAVSQTKNFTKAAKILYMSQPAITNSINVLENELGVRLFLRTKRTVELTAEGQAFYNYVSQLMKDVDRTLLGMQQFRESKKRILKIAVNSFISASFFLPLYRSYQEQNGGTGFQFVVCDNDTCWRLLEHDDYGIIFVIGARKDCPKNALILRPGRLVNVTSGQESSVLVRMQGNSMIDRVCDDHSILPGAGTVCHTISPETAFALLEQPGAQALLPDFLPCPETVERAQIPGNPEASVYMVWKDGLSEQYGRFIRFVHAEKQRSRKEEQP